MKKTNMYFYCNSEVIKKKDNETHPNKFYTRLSGYTRLSFMYNCVRNKCRNVFLFSNRKALHFRYVVLEPSASSSIADPLSSFHLHRPVIVTMANDTV